VPSSSLAGQLDGEVSFTVRRFQAEPVGQYAKRQKRPEHFGKGMD
jgi:hypothetical protein